MRSLVHDLLLGIRALRRRPGFAAISIVTLALGTGLNGAVFGILNAVVLRPLPFPDPDRLVSVTARTPDQDGSGLALGDAREIARISTVFEEVGWIERPSLAEGVVLTGAEPERVAGAWVSADFFRVLGVGPYRGRLLAPGEDEPGAAPVAVLDHAEWRARWDADPDVIGTTLPVNGQPTTIVGVLPPGFEVPLGGIRPILWIAQRPHGEAHLEDRTAWTTSVIGRLRPGASLADATAELDRYAADVAARYPTVHDDTEFVATGLREHWIGDVRGPLSFLFAAATLVLLVACLNLGILVAARNEERRREISVRRALGAGHARLARVIMTEVGLIAAAGTALGVALSFAVSGAVTALSPVALPRSTSPVDLRFILFAAGLAVAAALLVGALPLLRAVRRAPAEALRSRGTSGGGRRARGVAATLVAVECAAVVALLAGAALTTRGLRELLDVDPGFDPEGRLLVELTLPQSYTYRSEGGAERNAAFFADAPRRIRALPGVEGAGFVTNPPLTPAGWSGRLWKRGEAADAGWEPSIDWEVAGPGYFEAAGIPLVEGRAFAPSDNAEGTLVAIINETMARRYFAPGRALGAAVSGESESGPWRTVIGIVADVRQQSLGQPDTRPQMYVSDAQGFAWERRFLIVHASAGDPLALVAPVRRTLHEFEPDLTIDVAGPMRELIGASAAPARFHATLLGLYAIVAALLGLAGVYGVVSDSVSRRTRDIAVRLALGADGGRILRYELGRGLLPVVLGTLAGCGLAVAGARAARGVIHGLGDPDGLTLAGVGLGLALVATLAVLLPAVRAMRVSPARALREG